MWSEVKAEGRAIARPGGHERNTATRRSARALTFGAPQYRTVKQILNQGLDQQPDLIEIVERCGALGDEVMG